MTPEKTFQALLKLPEPWYIASIEIDEAGEAMRWTIILSDMDDDDEPHFDEHRFVKASGKWRIVKD